MAETRSLLRLAAVLAVWLVAGMIQPASAQVTFAPAVNIGVGDDPTSVAVGDFNNDGKLDLVTAIGRGSVAILLGNGNGTFGAATNFAVGRLPYSVAVGDFNNDGKLDVVTANQVSDNASVLLGIGNGTFGPATNFSVGVAPLSVAVGDFNGDGNLDLATANFTSNNASVLLGIGNGTFGAATNFSVGENPHSVTAGDFNADGKLDLAIANSHSHNVSLLLGNGNGTFGAASNFPVFATNPPVFPGTNLVVNFSPTSLAIGDFNNDGRLDLATANSGADSVTVLVGRGDGTFGSPTTFSVGLGTVRSLAIEDFNLDGKLDVVTANLPSTFNPNVPANTVSVLLGNGAGNLGTPTTFAVYSSEPLSVAIGDFNRDGKPDLVTANNRGGNISVLLSGDNSAPVISCGSADGLWRASDVSIACTAQDADSGLANPADANFLLTTNVPSGTENSNAATGTRTVCDTKNNCATAGPITGNKVDKKASSVSCLGADDQWHSANLSVACTASDGGSGLALAGDASFSLQTNVPSGAESATASGVPRNVCDEVSNCTPGTVPGGLKVDRKAPTITITTPQATRYPPRQRVAASYSCADGGSGVALCVGPVPSGSEIDTAPPAGRKIFTVFAADKTGNVSSQTVTYQIGTPGP